ncbi:PAS domain-containing protein [Candidatus Sulfurimonas baltica]|uniref:histidine kinase n=1 Tax=Candidatus Sulfurimonas baltica TaxID=2740404 RepID=A0A7S7LUN5_9BACT|nr:PAS domain-containing protein [Candidatus Sulfurimonas baltica]QOY51049.1 PAS domain-containing protein [Candidatus Sulfurimonas baltica]
MGKKIVAIGVISTLLFILSASMYYIYKSKELKSDIYQKQSESMKNKLSQLIDEKQGSTESIAFVLSKNKSVEEALLKKDKSLLDFSEIIKGLQKNKELENVWIQIIDIDGNSLYRSWTNNTGDSVAKARVDIAEFFLNPQPMNPISSGKFDLTFKSIQPVYKNNKLIGIIELISKFNSISEKLVHVGIEPIMLVEKSLTKKITKPFRKLFLDGHYVVNLNASKELMKKIEKAGTERFLSIENFILFENYIVTTYNLYTVRGELMAHNILFFKKENIDTTDLKSFQLYFFIFIFLFFAIITIAMWIYILIYNSKSLKKFNKVIKESEHMLRESQRIAKIGSLNLDLTTGSLKCSDEIFDIYNLDKESFDFRYESLSALVHEDDLQALKDAYIDSLIDRQPYSLTHRIVLKNGVTKYIYESCETVFDEDDNPVSSMRVIQDITTQKKLEDKINKAKEYLESVFEAVPSIVITTNGMRLHTANKAMLEFTKYKTVEDFLEDHTCICDLFIKEDGYLQTEMDGVNWIEYINQNKDSVHKAKMLKEGEVHIFVVNVKNIYFDDKDRSLVVFTDITEIEKLSERLEYAVGGTSDGIWDRNLELNEVYYSPRWKSMLGYEDYELVNEFDTWIELLHPDDLEKATDDMSQAYKNPKRQFESIYRLKHKDGHWIWILDRAQIISNLEGKAIRMVGFHTDITEIKKLEEELGDKEEIMIAQSRHAAMGEMISMIAHQWRQPISVISMDANNILTDIELEMIDEASLKSDSEDIIKQTQELSKTIDDFRNFFRPGKTKDEVLLQDVINDTLKVIGKSLETNGIELILELGEDIKIETFSRELMQVVINIVKNAKEALIGNKIESGKIFISVEDEIESLKIKICDNAGGIGDGVIKKIFEPYFSTKGEKDGTGLGLYMSKTIIEKHIGGALSVYNSDDGACFVIKLPLSIKV